MSSDIIFLQNMNTTGLPSELSQNKLQFIFWIRAEQSTKKFSFSLLRSPQALEPLHDKYGRWRDCAGAQGWVKVWAARRTEHKTTQHNWLEQNKQLIHMTRHVKLPTMPGSPFMNRHLPQSVSTITHWDSDRMVVADAPSPEHSM